MLRIEHTEEINCTYENDNIDLVDHTHKTHSAWYRRTPIKRHSLTLGILMKCILMYSRGLPAVPMDNIILESSHQVYTVQSTITTVYKVCTHCSHGESSCTADINSLRD